MTSNSDLQGDGVKLTKRLQDALRQVGSCDGKNVCFWWLRASMSKLEALGLTEQYMPPSVAERPRLKLRPYRITPAGLALLNAEAKATSHD